MLRLLCTLIFLSIFTKVFGISLGNAAKYGDAPWIVSLQVEENDFAYCGGTLIRSVPTNRIIRKEVNDGTNVTVDCTGWIVTTASCLKGVNNIVATLGYAWSGNLDLDKNEGKIFYIERDDVFPHADHKENFSTTENDIGLIKIHYTLTANVDEFKKADTICTNVPVLPYGKEHEMSETDYPQISATVFGWGLRLENGPLQKNLQAVTIPLKTHQECANDYKDDYKPASMICAGGQGRGPCSYDTGGPLTCQYSKQGSENNTTQFLCGIISFGLGCGENSFPAVFTDIVYFEDWINQTITENS